jgi:hypothetical protein
MGECRHEARRRNHTKSTAVNGSEVVSDVRSRRLRLGVRTGSESRGWPVTCAVRAAPLENAANVRVFVRNGIDRLTLANS